MTTSYQNEQDFVYKGEQSCKCLYALGEDGFSSLCNIIDPSPLYYIEADYSDEILDEEFLELEELRAELTGSSSSEDFVIKQKKLAGAGKHLLGYEKQDIEALYNENKNSLLSPKVHNADVKEFLNDFMLSKLGKSFYEFAAKAGVEVEYSDFVFNGLYDRDNAKIYINPVISYTAKVMNLATALRQVWHHKKGMLLHPLNFHPDDAILLNRLYKADAQTVKCRIAWELKLAGQEFVWEELMSSVSYDVAASFAREAIADFRSLKNGSAASSCFEVWFLSGRCKSVDKKLIQTMLADHNGMVFEHPETSRSATYEIIAGLGEMPGGKNYLSKLTPQITEDPLYAEVRDRSNANFLWFIKFERSFRDSEQNLHKSRNLSEDASVQNSKDLENVQPKRADIVSFKSMPVAKTGHRLDASAKENIATIYYLEHFKKPSQKIRSSE